VKCPRCGQQVMSYYNFCWRCGLDLRHPYKSLETQIIELWSSRGLEVLEEKVEHVEDDTFRWIITARRKKSSEEAEVE